MRAKPQPSGRNGTGRPGAPAKSSRPGALPGPVVGVQHLGEGEVEAGLALLPDDGRVHLAAPETAVTGELNAFADVAWWRSAATSWNAVQIDLTTSGTCATELVPVIWSLIS